MSVLRPAARAAAHPLPLPDPQVLRARRLLIGLYLLLGLTVATWLARLPTVRTSLDLTTGELGTILLVGALGSLATVVGAGAFVGRWGSRTTLLTAAVAFSVATVLIGLGPTVGSVPLLLGGILLMSSSFALGNVPLNVESVVIERRMGRTVVPHFHAAFSIGSVLGSMIGAFASWADVPLMVQFGVVSVVALVWRWRAVPGAVLPAPPAPVAAVGHHDSPPARRGAGLREAMTAWRERRTLLIGVVVMAAALSEGTANNWLAIAVVDGFEQTEAIAALVFGVFVASMTGARLWGTRLIDSFGRVPVLAGSGGLSLAGLLVFSLSPTLPVAVLGVCFWGMGAGLAVPIAMAAVSGDPLRAAGRVAVVSAFATFSAVSAPPLIGLAAESLGARHALLLISVVLLVGTLLAGVVRDPGADRSADPGAAPATLRQAGGVGRGPSTPEDAATGSAPDTLEGMVEHDVLESRVGR